MNRLTAYLLRLFLNYEMRRYGKMTTLRLDTEAKSISVTADLIGETAPIEAEIHYAIEVTEKGSFFVPLQVDCSREWLKVLATEFLKDGNTRLAIPKGLPGAVVKVLGL